MQCRWHRKNPCKKKPEFGTYPTTQKTAGLGLVILPRFKSLPVSVWELSQGVKVR